MKTVAIILCLASLGSLTLIHATLLRWRVELPLLPFSALRARRLDGTWFKSWDRGWADEGAGALPGYLARQGRRSGSRLSGGVPSLGYTGRL